MPTAPTCLVTRVPESSSTSGSDRVTITSEQLSFRFSNLCGSPYSGGSVVFSSDGTCLYTPVSNRIIITDLSSNRASAAIPELRSTTDIIAPMPSPSRIVLGIDVDGYGLLFESNSGLVLNRINFKGRVRVAKFSPDGKYLATAVGRKIKVWHSASLENNWQFVLTRTYVGHIGDVQSLDWAESETPLLLSAGADSIIRVWSLKTEDVPEAILNEHSQSIVGAFFFNGHRGVVAVNRAGAIMVWERGLDEHKNLVKNFNVTSRGSLQSGMGYVTSASFECGSQVLVLGLSGGAFSLFDVSSMTSLQSLSVGSSVGAVSLARGGDWVAVGVPESGQLMVWEWRAENFIMKQQGHHDGVNCVAFSPILNGTVGATDLMAAFGDAGSSGLVSSGGLIATGGVEGKIKLWHSASGFCFVTLSDHTSSVESIVFTPQGNAVISASADGSVRAYDLLRYKNFRTFTAPDARVQFGSLAIDPAGEIIAAGASNGNYAIYLWSVKTGQCVDVLVGHEARVSSLKFSPSADGLLSSTSWDGTLKVWNVFARKSGVPESLINQREVSCCAFDPIDGAIVAVATISGHIVFWDTKTGAEVGSIDGVRDISSGRKESERFSSGALRGKKSHRDGTGLEINLNQYFSAISYGGVSGRWLAAVSKNSAFLCLYDPLEKVLINRIELTSHWGLSGVKQFLNSKHDTDLVENDDFDDLDRAGKRARSIRDAMTLPGVERGDMTGSGKRVWRVNGLAVSADGQEIAVATSEGCIVLAMGEHGNAFNPFGLGVDVTERRVMECLEANDFGLATTMALQLNEFEIFKSVFDSVPVTAISVIVSQVPAQLLPPLVRHLASLLHPSSGSKCLERSMKWVLALLQLRFGELQSLVHSPAGNREMRAALCSVLQHVQTNGTALGNLLRDNYFQLGFLSRDATTEAVTENRTVKLQDIS